MLYFHVHQPERLRRFTVFDVGKCVNYFDDARNAEVLERVIRKCYYPMNEILLRLMARYGSRFKVAFSMSGVLIKQLQRLAPAVLGQLREMARIGGAEFVTETYYHSLAAVHSLKEFASQVEAQEALISRTFGIRPKVFRNTEFLYANHLAPVIEQLGYNVILTEGWEKNLGWRTPNFVYHAKSRPGVKVLLKNYRLSDDIAFRFSDRGWSGWPLTADRFAAWISAINGSGELINLCMDYETFGEHQWQETGIFEFIEHLPTEILRHPDNFFLTPSEAVTRFPARGEIDVPQWLTWADTERDLSAWLGNELQQAAARELYLLESQVKEARDRRIYEDWARLGTSDHFYYMCTKWFSDGDVHKYFSAYETPYDAYINFMNVLTDLKFRLKHKLGPKWRKGQPRPLQPKFKHEREQSLIV